MNWQHTLWSFKVNYSFFIVNLFIFYYTNICENKKNNTLLDISLLVQWTLVMLIFGSIFEGILSKTSVYLMKHKNLNMFFLMPNVW